MGNLTTQEGMITMAKAKRARDAKGHFISNKSIARRKSGGGKKSVKRSTSSSPARRASGGGKVVRRRRVHVSGGVVNGTIRELKQMGPELGGALAYGFITKATTPMAAQARGYLEKLPTWSKIGKPASHGVIFLAAGIAAGGKIRRVLGLLSKAALFRAADNVGATALDLDAAAKLAGDEEGSVHLAGEIDDAEIVG